MTELMVASSVFNGEFGIKFGSPKFEIVASVMMVMTFDDDKIPWCFL